MAERPDDRWTNEGMGDKGGAGRHRTEPSQPADERWPEEGFRDKGGAARRRVIEGDPDHRGETQELSGSSSQPPEKESGYGGGRERAEQLNSQSFGETGWGGARGTSTPPEPTGESTEYPEGVSPARDSPDWDERFARENGDKYGQAGGQPIVQRGSAQSQGGFEHREQSLGDTRNLEGGYGVRDTERRGGSDQPDHAGEGPKK